MEQRSPAEQERYDTLTDTWASFALDGRLPTPEDVRLGRAYVSGELSLEQILAWTRARYPQVT